MVVVRLMAAVGVWRWVMSSTAGYLLLIFIPGKDTEGGPLFASAKLVVLGRPLIVGKVQTGREHDKSPVSFHCEISAS